ncbi:hypothetical protein ABKN59_007883 [Abortiporus biennis]
MTTILLKEYRYIYSRNPCGFFVLTLKDVRESGPQASAFAWQIHRTKFTYLPYRVPDTVYIYPHLTSPSGVETVKSLTAARIHKKPNRTISGLNYPLNHYCD